METLPHKPIVPNDNKELSQISETLNSLLSSITELEEFKAVLEEMSSVTAQKDDKFKEEFLSSFNAFHSKADTIISKLNNEVDYVEKLNSEIREKELKNEVSLLEKQLIKEEAKISNSLENINSSVNNLLEKVVNKIDTLKEFDQKIEETLMEFRQNLLASTKSETIQVSEKCTQIIQQFLEKSQNTLEVVKKNSITFLEQCEKEHLELIKKIPSIKYKISTKDIIFYSISALNILLLIFLIFIN